MIVQAAYLVTVGYNFIGAQADINVWNPKVELPEDFTTAQIWNKAGNGADFESVESGWVVSSLAKLITPHSNLTIHTYSSYFFNYV